MDRDRAMHARVFNRPRALLFKGNENRQSLLAQGGSACGSCGPALMSLHKILIKSEPKLLHNFLKTIFQSLFAHETRKAEASARSNHT